MANQQSAPRTQPRDATGQRRKGRTRAGKTQAARADKYDLYQRSVQEPESQCRFFERVYSKVFGRSPVLLREDFCGTAAVCCEWVRRRSQRQALGCDLDPEPLQWGLTHNVGALPPAAQARVSMLQADVRTRRGARADVLSAENFSYFIFTTRDELRRYFRAARRNLADEGLLVLDIMGGPQVMEEDREELRRIRGATYVWEQHRFDPITAAATYFIHFRFRDGSSLRRAFRYDWRLWTVPEVREILLEAGFSRVDVYWEGATDDGDGNGIFRLQKSAPSDPAWIAYVVGVKQGPR